MLIKGERKLRDLDRERKEKVHWGREAELELQKEPELWGEALGGSESSLTMESLAVKASQDRASSHQIIAP